MSDLEAGKLVDIYEHDGVQDLPCPECGAEPGQLCSVPDPDQDGFGIELGLQVHRARWGHEGVRRYAPWPDFHGNKIKEYDAIRHPSGEEGTVVFMPEGETPEDQWRVSYLEGNLGRLCLQVGDKGQAVVVTSGDQAQ